MKETEDKSSKRQALTADLEGMKELAWPLVKKDRERHDLSPEELEDLAFMRGEIKVIEEKLRNLGQEGNG